MSAQIQLDNRRMVIPSPQKQAWKTRRRRTPKKGGAPCKYPWDRMEIGESFLVPCKVADMDRLSSALGSNMHQRTQRYGQKFTKRRVRGGIRVWRIA
jgi:hypothetical protein